MQWRGAARGLTVGDSFYSKRRWCTRWLPGGSQSVSQRFRNFPAKREQTTERNAVRLISLEPHGSGLYESAYRTVPIALE